MRKETIKREGQKVNKNPLCKYERSIYTDFNENEIKIIKIIFNELNNMNAKNAIKILLNCVNEIENRATFSSLLD